MSKISDECLYLNGENTLLTMDNGVGKTVMVQLITSLFVHKKDRNVKERPFAGYFNSNKPSFIMVEWSLDGGNGFVLTGMMVRQNQHMDESSNEQLEMINFVAEYKEPCSYDINHLAIVEKNNIEINLKSFSSCRQFFDDLKRKPGIDFFYFDMNSTSQSRQYFENIKNYGIDCREWESIIHELNRDESGLSNLFNKCKSERDLIEKWFLPVIEEKLKHNKDRISEFREIVKKYVKSYQNNVIKIQCKENIEYLEQRAQEISITADKLKNIEEQEGQQLLQLQWLYKEIERLKLFNNNQLKETNTSIDDLVEEIFHLEQERLSAEYYSKLDDYEYQFKIEQDLTNKLRSLKEQFAILEKTKHILECAYEQKMVDNDILQLCRLEQKREELNRKNEDKQPEINYLGFKLKKYYQKILHEQEGKILDLKYAISEINTNIKRLKDIDSTANKDYRTLAQTKGRLEAEIDAYNRLENDYNKKYNEKLQRNILGKYEDGGLRIEEEDLNKKISENEKQIVAFRKKLITQEEELKIKEREYHDIQELQEKNKYDIRSSTELLDRYNTIQEERKRILDYVGLPESELFNYQNIAKKLQDKISQNITSIKRATMEEASLKKDCNILESGRNLELSEELLDLMGINNINVVQGLEWLKKNDLDTAENKKLVERLPFLPYSLIMSANELHRLKTSAQQVKTSVPIPIVLREDLVHQDGETQLLDYQKLHFYLFFNDDLLDESKVAEMKERLTYSLNRKVEELTARQEEHKLYSELEHILKQQQNFTKESLLEVKNNLFELEYEKTSLQQRLTEVIKNIEDGKSNKSILEKSIYKAQEYGMKLNNQMEVLQELQLAYDIYMKHLHDLQGCIQSIFECDKKIKQTQAELQNCRNKNTDYSEKLSYLKRQADEQSQKAEIYQGYKDVVCPSSLEGLKDDFNILESRYIALVDNYNGEMRELENQIKSLKERSIKSQSHLDDLAKNYSLKNSDWSETEYSEVEESRTVQRLKEVEQEKEECQQEEKSAHKNSALAKHKMDNVLERLRSECALQDPLVKSAIKVRDYGAEREMLISKKKELERYSKKLKERLDIYESAQDAVAEFKCDEDISNVEIRDFSSFSREELREYYSEMKVHYRSIQKEENKNRIKLKEVIDGVLRDEQLRDEFFQRQLKTLESTYEHGDRTIKQLEIILQVCRSFMEKLKLDLAIVEQEKLNVLEMLLDYVSNVHEEMSKLDKNSAITIRGRSIKMLRLVLPAWSENQEVYHGMMQEIVDEITERAMRLLEAGTAIDNMVNQEITTRNLYDTVIGINNIGIQLYKIERDRETQIMWREVARNSGGEGFLSAFVILSSLLYYMRRDDTDVFADRNEGKVLLMDNPFAKTYSSHLLQPMMEVARKNNTQLICLTGLSGDSIYDRFNNIYMLRLINSSLSNVRYLSSKHISGDEPKVMKAEHFMVTDAMEEITLF